MSYKIAIASSDGINIDQHFGEISSLLVFDVNENDGSFSLDCKRDVPFPKDEGAECEESGCSCGKGFTDRITQTVKDCQYFLVAKIGNRPHRFLQENNVNCIEAPFPIEDAVKKLNGYFVKHKSRELHVF